MLVPIRVIRSLMIIPRRLDALEKVMCQHDRQVRLQQMEIDALESRMSEFDVVGKNASRGSR